MNLIKIADTYSNKIGSLVPQWFILLSLRTSIFLIFWLSVQTKITGGTIFGQHLFFWNLTDNTFLLFEYEYDVPFLPATIAAYLATIGEFFLSLGIIFGLFTRFSALGLILMTVVIQYAYPNWQTHLLWLGMLLVLLKYGGGLISLDKALVRN